MLTRTVISLGVCVAAGLLSTSAVAGSEFEGSFAGIAYGSRLNAQSPNPGSFDGEAVSGTFSLNLTTPAYDTRIQPNWSSSLYPAGTVLLHFIAHGQTIDFTGQNGQASEVALSNAAGIQKLTLTTDVSNPYRNATLVLAGPLFDGLDVNSIQAGNIDLTNSAATFSDGRAFGASVALTRLSFISSVPEPGTIWLITFGLASIAFLLRKKQRKVNH